MEEIFPHENEPVMDNATVDEEVEEEMDCHRGATCILHEKELVMESKTVDEGEPEEEMSIQEEEFVMDSATVNEREVEKESIIQQMILCWVVK